MVNAEFSRIYRFVKLLVNEGFLAVIPLKMLVRTPVHCHLRDRLRTPFCSLKMICTHAFPTYYVSNVVTALKKQ